MSIEGPPSDGPQEVDIYVGQMIRAQRRLGGFSQSDLANAVGVSFQQIQKYEKASNRVSASMLVAIANALECSPIDLLPSVLVPGASSKNVVVAMTALRTGLEVAEMFVALDERDRRVLPNVARSLSGQLPIRDQDGGA